MTNTNSNLIYITIFTVIYLEILADILQLQYDIAYDRLLFDLNNHFLRFTSVYMSQYQFCFHMKVHLL